MAMRWEGKINVDPMLPFGLQSAPKIFNAIADALNWHLHCMGIPLIRHYLDCPTAISTVLAILNRECTRLGFPIADHKRDGLMTCLTFLGIEIDPSRGQLRLPVDKLSRLRALLVEWGDCKT